MKTRVSLAILAIATTVGTTAAAFVGFEWSASFRSSEGFEPSPESAAIMIRETAKAGFIGTTAGASIALGLAQLIAGAETARAKARITQLRKALKQDDMSRVVAIETEIKEGNYAD